MGRVEIQTQTGTEGQPPERPPILQIYSRVLSYAVRRQGARIFREQSGGIAVERVAGLGIAAKRGLPVAGPLEIETRLQEMRTGHVRRGAPQAHVGGGVVVP